ncbi:MAG: threonine synthase [Bacteroidota bacterium]
MPSSLFISTRGASPTVPFATALLDGLAPDGGLYVPTHIPPLASGWEHASSMAEIGAHVLRPWLANDFGTDRLDAIVADALSFPIPLVGLAEDGWDQISVLELFHGPTLSFKDVGARTMARLMAEVLDEPITILAATSGDTGSAVADGFAGVEGVRVVLLYPKGQVSAVQERQLVVERSGVQTLAVEGTFDDCQRLVKAAFQSPPKGVRLSSANSINIGRLLPQMTYYAWALRQLESDESPIVIVPSGNLGNLTAGVLMQLSGLPIRHFVAAHNANDGFPRFLTGGPPPEGISVRTLSNAMDVGTPSNAERLTHLLGSELATHISGDSIDDATTLATMRTVHEHTGYVADPHTAVGLTAAQRLRQHGETAPLIVLSTAHPAKFPESVELAIGETPESPARLAALWDAPTRVETIPATLDARVERLAQ